MTTGVAAESAPTAPAPEAAPSPVRRLWRWPRRHPLMAALVALGVLLRVALHLAYSHAFYIGDSIAYIYSANGHDLSPIRPFGYSAYLMAVGTSHPIRAIALQHAMIVILAVVIYAFLLRRGVRPVIAALATAPLLLGPSEAMIEHYLLAEPQYTVLTVAGLILLTRLPRAADVVDRPLIRILTAIGAGGLLALATLMRSIGLPLCVLAVAYVLLYLRRVGWRPAIAFGLALAAPLAAYMIAYHSQHGAYAFGGYQGRFLYARTMTIADCERLPLTDREKLICEPVDRSQRSARPDHYLWAAEIPANQYFAGPEHDKELNAFAVKVIKNQPGDYAAMIVRETSWHFLPGWRPTDQLYVCLLNKWVPAEQLNTGCGPDELHLPGSLQKGHLKLPVTEPTALTRGLTAYGATQAAYGPMLGLLLLGLLAVAIGRLVRRRGDKNLADAILFAAAGLGMIVVSVATSMFETRYAIPAIPLICVGAALAVRPRH